MFTSAFSLTDPEAAYKHIRIFLKIVISEVRTRLNKEPLITVLFLFALPVVLLCMIALFGYCLFTFQFFDMESPLQILLNGLLTFTFLVCGYNYVYVVLSLVFSLAPWLHEGELTGHDRKFLVHVPSLDEHIETYTWFDRMTCRFYFGELFTNIENSHREIRQNLD